MKDLTKKEQFLVKGLFKNLAIVAAQYICAGIVFILGAICICWYAYVSNKDGLGELFFYSVFASIVFCSIHYRIQNRFRKSLDILKRFSRFI